ncbi:MAG: VOC family protein [Phycisphaeraceae bacterium]
MSKRPPRPSDMPWMLPTLTVRDVDRALDFYEKALGFEPGTRMPGPGGKTMHGDMRYRDHIVMLGPETDQMPDRAPVTTGTPAPISLYVYVEDVDASFKRAVDAGCKVGFPVEDMFWGDRCGQVIDPEGYNWWLATNVADFDPSKVPTQ